MAAQDLDLQELVESIVFDFKDKAREKRQSLLGYVEPEVPPMVHADAELLRSMLSELTDIALSIAGAVDVCLMASQQQLEVRGGDEIPVLFSVSYAQQLERPTDYLSAVERKLADAGISLQFSRTTARGSELSFLIYLQQSKARKNDAWFPEEMRSFSSFLVSNEPPPNRAVHAYLRSHGLRCEGAPTGGETLLELTRQASQGDAYDIVLVAPPIEDVNHIEIARAVKSSQISNTKLLHIDRYEDAEQKKRSLESGYDAYISKPFRKADFLRIVAEMCGFKYKSDQQPPALVLVAEDNAINQKLILFQLKQLGVEADIACNGQEALDLLDKGRDYGVILMDLHMPVMNGFEAAEIIRKRSDRFSQVPIIAVSADDSKEATERCKKIGFSDFIVKPASVKNIRAALEKWLPKSSPLPARR
jgi:CheY-like chemotaxis protein